MIGFSFERLYDSVLHARWSRSQINCLNVNEGYTKGHAAFRRPMIESSPEEYRRVNFCLLWSMAPIALSLSHSPFLALCVSPPFSLSLSVDLCLNSSSSRIRDKSGFQRQLSLYITRLTPTGRSCPPPPTLLRFWRSVWADCRVRSFVPGDQTLLRTSGND